MRAHRFWVYAGLVAYPLGSSLAGLATAILAADVRIFRIVWGASLLGDVLFVGGSLAVGWGAYRLARHERWAASILLGLIGTWFVYTLAWSVTGPAIHPSNNADFARADAASWVFVLQWGWPGILFAAAGPALASLAWSEENKSAAVGQPES